MCLYSLYRLNTLRNHCTETCCQQCISAIYTHVYDDKTTTLTHAAIIKQQQARSMHTRLSHAVHATHIRHVAICFRHCLQKLRWLRDVCKTAKVQHVTIEKIRGAISSLDIAIYSSTLDGASVVLVTDTRLDNRWSLNTVSLTSSSCWANCSSDSCLSSPTDCWTWRGQRRATYWSEMKSHSATER